MAEELVKWSCPRCSREVTAPTALELSGRIKEHKGACEGWKGEVKMAKTEDKNQEEKPLLPILYDAATGELARKEVIPAALEFAKEVGIKPELGHLCLYHGKPWISIQGWYYLLRQKFPRALLLTRPLNSEERANLKIDDQLHAWIAEVYEEEGGKKLSIGYGYASKEEALAKGSAVEPRWPWRLAEKRAEEDAIRKAVGL